MKNILRNLGCLLIGLSLAYSCSVNAATAYNQFVPANGILKGSTSTPVTTAATWSDVQLLLTGTCNSSVFVRGDGTCVSLGITPAALTKADDTNVTLTLGGTPTTALLQATSITAGWTGTLAASRGGLGMSTVTDDTLPVANGTTWQSKALTDCDDTGGQHLNYDTGTNAFSCGTSGAVTGAALTKTDDTNVTLTLGGSPTTALVNAASITAGWTGTLSAARGGLGMSTVTDDTVAVANGTTWQSKALTDCDGATSAVTYDTTTNAWGCNTLGAHPTGANPSASVGLSAVNGSASTFMRSDGAPALSQSIAPTWTAQHIFTQTGHANSAAIRLNSADPAILFNDTNNGTDAKNTEFISNGNVFALGLVDDAFGNFRNVLSTTRSAGAVSSITAGNATDNPTFTLAGTGAAAFGGTLTATGKGTFNAVGSSSADTVQLSSTLPMLRFTDTDAGADGGNWQMFASGTDLVLRTTNDANSTANNVLDVVRSGASVSSLTFGNATNNPTYTFGGTGTAFFGGPITSSGVVTMQTSGATAAQVTGSVLRLGDGKASGDRLVLFNSTARSASNLEQYFSFQPTELDIYAYDGSVTTGGTVRFRHSQARFADGSAGTPVLSFASDTNTGAYLISGDRYGISTGGTLRLDISSSAVEASAPLQVQAGAVGGALSLNSTSTNGSYMTFQRSGSATSDIGVGKNCGGSFTGDALCLTARTGNPLEMSAGGRSSPDVQITSAGAVNINQATTLAGTSAPLRLKAVDSLGDNYIQFYSSDGTTSRGYLGNGSSASNEFQLSNDVSGANLHLLTTGSGAITLDPGASSVEVTVTAAGGVQVGSPTGGDKGAGTLNATGLYINGTSVDAGSESVGTFTGTLTGMTSTTNCNMKYRKVGSFVTLYIASGSCSGTSNSTAMTMTGLPAAIQPSLGVQAVAGTCLDNGTGLVTMCLATISAAGSTITFSVAVSNATTRKIEFDGSGWASSNSKGLNTNWVIQYQTSN